MSLITCAQLEQAISQGRVTHCEVQGQPRERVSRIRVRRLPVWSEYDHDRSRANARKFIADLKKLQADCQ